MKKHLIILTVLWVVLNIYELDRLVNSPHISQLETSKFFVKLMLVVYAPYALFDVADSFTILEDPAEDLTEDILEDPVEDLTEDILEDPVDK